MKPIIIHVVAPVFVFEALGIIPSDRTMKKVEVQFVDVQTGVEQEAEEVCEEFLVQAVQAQDQEVEFRKKDKESSLSRRIRRLESKKRKKIQVEAEAAVVPLLPFERKL